MKNVSDRALRTAWLANEARIEEAEAAVSAEITQLILGETITSGTLDGEPVPYRAYIDTLVDMMENTLVNNLPMFSPRIMSITRRRKGAMEPLDFYLHPIESRRIIVSFHLLEAPFNTHTMKVTTLRNKIFGVLFQAEQKAYTLGKDTYEWQQYNSWQLDLADYANPILLASALVDVLMGKTDPK